MIPFILTHPMIIEPSQIFAGDEVQVMVRVGLSYPEIKNGLKSRPILIEVTETGQKIRNIGPLHDDGVMGDAHARDGIYTLRLKMAEVGSRSIRYSVSAADEEPGPFTALGLLEVDPRPSFIDLLKKVWQRFFG